MFDAEPRDEEEILEALYKVLEGVRFTLPGSSVETGFKQTSRRVKLWGDVPTNQKPACFQAEHANQEDQTTNLPYKATVMVNWIVYQSAGKDSKAIPTKHNSAILKGIRKALRPTPRDPGFRDRRNTLGGLVHHCYISGRVFKDPGDIDGEGMMVIPIKLLVPSL